MRKRFICIALVLLVGLTGCGDNKEKLEKQEAYRKIGMDRMAEGDYEGAVEAFQKALDQSLATIGELELDTCYYKAEAQYLAGKPQDAIETYTALIDYDEENAKAYFLRGSLYLAEGQMEDGQKDYKEAIRYGEEDYELHIGIAAQLSAMGDSKQAEKYLKQALEIGGKNAESYVWRGRIYLMLEDYENAKKELEEALKKENTEANLYLGEVYEKMGEDDKAEKYFAAYIEKHAKDTDALEGLADIAIEQKDYAKAASYLETALETKNPVNEQSLRRKLIQAYEFSGNFTAAKKEMETYIEDYPDDEAAVREHEFLKTR